MRSGALDPRSEGRTMPAMRWFRRAFASVVVVSGGCHRRSPETETVDVTDSSSGEMLPGPSRGGAASPSVPSPPSDSPLELSALVFTRTAAFRHESIEHAVAFFEDLDPTEGWTITASEDPTLFNDESLSSYDVVAFVNTTGDVLDEAQQGALARYVTAGGGFVGVHAAADTEHDWPWYGDLVGARFVNHPEVPLEAELRIDSAGADHQSVAHFQETFRFTDEWYNFDRNPRGTSTVLLTVDEADFTVPNTPPGPSMGPDHPIAWFHSVQRGRAFYTNLGHRPQTWGDARFTTHLLEGMRWAAGGGHYSRAILTADLQNPLALAVTPAGDVYIIERTGHVRLWHAATGQVTTALELEVDTGYENGLLGIAIDPAFPAPPDIYLYASLPRLSEGNVQGPPGTNAVLRFRARDDGSLDPASRAVILEVPSERRCCHEGGALAFATDGALFVATGDNTNPFESHGMAPLDGRPGRETFDARRTSANPDDLRGKVLRIRTDGSSPPGNLFANGGGRPEIYAMGVRNPFRIAVDPERGWLYLGDVGPDAQADGLRGPRGYDEINLAQGPGDFGWPFCIGFDRPYAAVDWTTQTIGAPYDCSAKVPPLLAYDYDTVSYEALGDAFDDAGQFVGRTAIAGAVARPSDDAAPAHGWPRRRLGNLLMTDWTRDIVAAVSVDDAGTQRGIDRMFASEVFRRPVDLELGSDGSLFVLEYGSSFWGDNEDARLSRLQLGEPGSLAPVADIDATASHGTAPLEVTFSAEASRAPREQHLVDYLWDVDVDGTIEARTPTFTHRFEGSGRRTIGLVVISNRGVRSKAVAVDVVVGNAPPEVTIHTPERGTRFELGRPVLLTGSAQDPEDGVASCDELVWNIGLIHNAHAHPLRSMTGCQVEFTPEADDHEPTAELLSYSIELVYTDHGGPGGEPPLTARQGLQFELAPPAP